MHNIRTQLLVTAAMLALSGAAYPAELPVKAPPPVAPAAPVTNWTGFYVGAQIGGAGFDPSCSTTYPLGNAVDGDGPCEPFFSGKAFRTSSFSSTAFIGGAKIGYDWEFWSHAVVGVVGDFDWTNLHATQYTTFTPAPAVLNSSASEKIDWLASVRGRLGWAFDSVLFYATGGVAWTQIKNNESEIFPLAGTTISNFAGQSSTDKTGVVAGGGFEYRFTPNLSVVGELLWYDFGTTSISVANAGFGGTITTQFNNNDILVGTLGANWRF
jgi:outer membrane immunogenic protein